MVDVQTVAYHRWHDWSGSPLAPASVGDSGCGGWEAHLKIHAAPVMPRARHRARHRAPQCSGQPHHPSQGRGVGHSGEILRSFKVFAILWLPVCREGSRQTENTLFLVRGPASGVRVDWRVAGRQTAGGHCLYRWQQSSARAVAESFAIPVNVCSRGCTSHWRLAASGAKCAWQGPAGGVWQGHLFL
jgi:hypothetical protein